LVFSGNGNTVELCFSGTAVDGASALGNSQAGILITGNYNTVGGLNGVGNGAQAQFNLIAGNTGPGILITGTNAYVNAVVGNWIGLSLNGVTTLPNAHGVSFENGCSYNRAGSTNGGGANIIVANSGDGISVVDTATIANAFLENVIYANGGLGIDLKDDGVTANDA